MKLSLGSLCVFVLVSVPSSAAQQDDCNLGTPIATGVVQNPAIDEASGLADSRVNPGVLYTQNDSGDAPRVFAIDQQGFTIADIRFPGVISFDMEDICAGQMSGGDFVFAGDIGNSYYDRFKLRIFRFMETDLSQANGDVIQSDYVTYTVDKPDLIAEDQETLLFDPASKDMYIVQKNHNDSSANIYRFTPTDTDSDVYADFVGNIPYFFLVGGDISVDGTRIVLRSPDFVYEWFRPDPTAASVEDTLMNSAPCVSELEAEPQGEALAIASDQTGFFTTSEGLQQPIYFYEFS